MGGKSLSVLILITILSWKAICEAIASVFLQKKISAQLSAKEIVTRVLRCVPRPRGTFSDLIDKNAIENDLLFHSLLFKF